MVKTRSRELAMTVDTHRKLWNQQQQTLQALLRSGDHQAAVELFLDQHARVHSAVMAGAGLWSFEDEALQNLSEAAMRRIPAGCDHSIAWVIWHLARIEDVTMNLLVGDQPQVLYRENWPDKLGISACDTGNASDAASVAALGSAVDVEALKAYRQAVGRSTRQVAVQLQPEALKQKIEPSRLQRVMAEGAVIEAARDVIDFWGRHTRAGLLLMPATRHNFVHLNEALRLRKKSLALENRPG